MSKLHKMLIRQLKKSGVELNQVPQELLLLISNSYSEYEEQIDRKERINILSEQELLKKNDEIESNNKNDFEALLNRLPGYVSWLDENLNYLGLNSNLESIIGIPKAEIIGKKAGEVYLSNNKEFYRRLTQFSESNSNEDYFEYVLETEIGERNILTYLQKLNNGKKIIVYGVDLTEKVKIQKKLEESRIQNEQNARLASLGSLAAGIAHEINNPLMIIKGNCFLIEKHYAPLMPEEKTIFNDRVSHIYTNIERVSTILSNLKVLSTEVKNEEWRPIPINKIMTKCLTNFQSKLSNLNIDLKLKSIHDPLVNCIPEEVEKVITCVLSNSIDAIETKNERWIKIEIMGDESISKIKISDSGNGISKTNQEKIFEPFFTTKDPGKGTGLGLSVSKKIINKFGGDINYEDGVHTTFIITLPSVYALKEVKSA